MAAVLDPRGAVDRFTVLEHGDRGFVLVPREPGGVDRLEVVLGGGDLPEEVIVVDPQGATNRLRFTDWQKSDLSGWSKCWTCNSTLANYPNFSATQRPVMSLGVVYRQKT